MPVLPTVPGLVLALLLLAVLAFRFWKRGIGSTLTTLLILFLLIFISFIFKSIGKRVYYEVE